jgi:hypothetical protein
MAKSNSTAVLIDGQAAALQLLHSLAKMNWTRDAPAKSMRAVKGAIQCAATYPGKEFDRFSRVISDWLAEEVLGCGLDLKEHEADLKNRGR